MKLGDFLFVDKFNVLPPKATLFQRIKHLRRANWATIVNAVHLAAITLSVAFGLAFGWGLGVGLAQLIFKN